MSAWTVEQMREVWRRMGRCASYSELASLLQSWAPEQDQPGLSYSSVYRLLAHGRLPKDARCRDHLLKYVPRALLHFAASRDCVEAIPLNEEAASEDQGV